MTTDRTLPDMEPIGTYSLGGGVTWVLYADGGTVVTLPGRGVFTVAQLGEMGVES